ncbi:MAG: antibiotic biosynthesis monooxygenase family protein [Pseudomonadota bacterium]
MIIVRITMNVLPEKQKEMEQTLISMIWLMKQAAGCRSYVILSDVENINLLNLIGEWRTRKDLDNHLKSEIFSIFLGTKSLLKEPLGIHIYTVIKSEGMEAVTEARWKENDSAMAVISKLLPEY